MTKFATSTVVPAEVLVPGTGLADFDVQDYAVIVGDTGTAEGVIEGSLGQLIGYFNDVAAKLTTERTGWSATPWPASPRGAAATH